MSDDPWQRLMSLEGVPSAFAAARDGIDAVLRDRGPRRTTPAQTAESLLRGAQASAVLEGSVSSLEEVRRGAGDDIANAAVRVSADLLSLAPTLTRAPLQVLARLHTLAAAGAVPGDRLGRPRDAESAARLREVAAALTTPTAAPALLVAAGIHADLLTAEPFGSRDGLVARAVERLVLVARGVDERSLVVPEAGHLARRASYDAGRVGYRDGTASGLTAWLLHAAAAYAAGVEVSPVLD